MSDFVLREESCIILDFPGGPKAVKIVFLDDETEISRREQWLMKVTYNECEYRKKLGLDSEIKKD